MEPFLYITGGAAFGGAVAILWFKQRLLTSFRSDPVKTVRAICREAFQDDELFD